MTLAAARYINWMSVSYPTAVGASPPLLLQAQCDRPRDRGMFCVN